MSVQGKVDADEDLNRPRGRLETGESSGAGNEKATSDSGENHGDGGSDSNAPLDLPEDIVEAVRGLSLEELRQRILRSPSPARRRRSEESPSVPHTPPGPTPLSPREDTECHFKTKTVPFREVMDLLREERAIWDKLAKKQAADRPTRRHVLPPKPASYDGLSHGEVFLQDYISFIEDSCYDEAVNEDYVMSLPAFLSGRARAWYKRLANDDKKDWEVLMGLFKERFITHFQNRARKSYKRRMQGEQESVAEYSLDMDELMTSACVPPDEMLSVYVANLRECLSEQVLKHNPKDVREAEKVAMEIEASFLASAIYVKPHMKTRQSHNDPKLVQRIVDRVQAIQPLAESSLQEISTSQEQSDHEEELVRKVLERLQPKTNKAPPKASLAALSMDAGEAQPGKKNKPRKKKKTAPSQPEGTPTPNAAPPNQNFPMFQPVPFQYFPQFQGQNMFPFPPPTQPPVQPRATQAAPNQGN